MITVESQGTFGVQPLHLSDKIVLIDMRRSTIGSFKAFSL